MPYTNQPRTATPASLQCLQPVALVPQRYTAPPQALTALQRVESVVTSETRQRNTQSVFVLDVCFARRRIPVQTSRGLLSLSTARASLSTTGGSSTSTTIVPDLQVERTLKEFRRLRDAVYYAANSKHGVVPCAYCRAMTDFVLLGANTPHRMMQLLQQEDQQCASLSQFLQELLALAVQTKPLRGTTPCNGQQRIPEIVCDFLQLDATAAFPPSTTI